MAFTPVTVTGSRATPGGQSAEGYLTFQLSDVLVDSSDNTTVERTREVALLDDDGEFSVQLVATDDLTTQPSMATYQVSECITGAPPKFYEVIVPHAGGATQQLEDLPPVYNPANTVYGLLPQNNLSDVLSAEASRDNLGLEIGVDIQAYDPDLGNLAGKTIPAGDIVGTTDSQTLSNKTHVNPTIGSFVNAGHTHTNAAGGGKLDHGAALNNVGVNTHDQLDTGLTNSTNHIGSVSAHGVTGEVVGTQNVQTLTNKTMTSAVLNAPVITGGSIDGIAGFGSDTIVIPTSGTLTVAANPRRFYMDDNYTIGVGIRVSVNTAPVGSSVIVDVKKNGETIFGAAPTNRPTILAGSFTAISGTPNITNLVAGDYLTTEVLQVGSSTPGADLTTQIVVTPATMAAYPDEILKDNPLAYWRFNLPEGVYLDGTTGYLTTPDATALSVLGDFEVRAKLKPDNWASATEMIIAAKDAGGSTREWALSLASGNLKLATANDGATMVTSTSTVVVPFLANGVGWCRATMDVNNNAAGRDVKFYTSVDGITWTQLGSTVTTPGVTFQTDTTAAVSLGANATGASPFAGTILQFELRNGLVGPVVIGFNAEGNQQATSSTWIDPSGGTARTWTLTGGANPVLPSRMTGMRTLAVSEFVQCADSSALDITGDIDIRACLCPAKWTGAPGNLAVVGKYATADRAYALVIDRANVGTIGLYVDKTPGNGSGQIVPVSTAAVPFANGVTGTIRATLDVDNGSSGYTARFYTSADNGQTWTLLGSPVTNTPVFGPIWNSAAPLKIGSETIFDTVAGIVYWAEVRNGIDGPVVARYDASKAALNTELNYSQRILAANPVGYWKLDEPSGTTALDSSGNGYNLTYTGSPTLGAPGAIVNDPSTACNFGGIDGKYASRAATPALNPSGSFSFECWVNHNALDAATGYIWDNSGNGMTASGWAVLSAVTTSAIQFHIRNAANTATRTIGSVTFPSTNANQWHHIVAVYDAPLDKMTIYFNGVSESSNIAGTGILLTANPTIYLSKYYGSTTNTFRGRLAHAALYNTALSQAQVNDHYLAGRGFLPYGTGTINDDYGNTWTLQGKARYVNGANPVRTANKPALGTTGLIAGTTNKAVTLVRSSSQTMSVPYSAAHNPPSFSLEAWVRLVTVSGVQYLFSTTDAASGTTGFRLNVEANGLLTFTVNTLTAITSATALVAGTTYHIVVTSSPGAQTMFINGNLEGTGARTYTPNSTLPLYFGSDSALASCFDGVFDEVVLYPVVLDAARVRAHYRLGSGT